MSSLLVYNPNGFCLAGAIPGGGGRGGGYSHTLAIPGMCRRKGYGRTDVRLCCILLISILFYSIQ